MKALTDKRRLLQQNGVWAAIILSAVLCAVLLTLVAERLEDRLHLQWDLTQNKVYTIGNTSKSVLSLLDSDIVIYTVYPAGGEDMTVGELLSRYETASGHIEVKNIDPVSSPLFIKQFEQDGETIENNSIIVARADNPAEFIVIEPKNLYEWKLEGEQLYATGMVAEQRITSAIYTLSGGEQATAFFAEGHGEIGLSELYYLEGTLGNDEYKVKSYNLVYNDTELKKSDCLIFVSPSKDLSDEEYRILDSFLDGGGKAVFLFSLTAPDMPNFNKIMEKFGFALKYDLVVEKDADRYYSSPVVLRPNIGVHEATGMLLDAKAYAVMPRCRSIDVRQVSGIDATVLYETSADSYAKINPMTETLDREDGDIGGPLAVAAAAENPSTGARVVVFGSTDFISTLENAKFAGNLTSFMNAVSWASGNKGAVAIEPKSMLNPTLQVTSTNQSYLLTALVVAAMPFAVVLFGFLVWRRRIKR